MRGRLHHPTCAAGWPKAASLARKGLIARQSAKQFALRTAGHQVLVTAGVALDAQKPVFEQAALQVVVELPMDEMRRGCAFGLQPGKKLRVAGLDDAMERRLFRSVAFVDVAVGTAGSKQSSQPASAWVDKAGRRRTTRLSAWAVPGWRRRARFDVGILLTSPGAYKLPLFEDSFHPLLHRAHGCVVPSHVAARGQTSLDGQGRGGDTFWKGNARPIGATRSRDVSRETRAARRIP